MHEIHNQEIFPIFPVVNGTAIEIGLIWFIDMDAHFISSSDLAD